MAMGVAAGLVSIGIGASIGVSTATANTDPTAAGPDPSSVLAVLDTPAESFPANIDTDALIRGGIDRSSLQKLGSEGPRSFWTGLDNAGDICLIAILDARQTTAASCNSAQNVEDQGLDLSAFGDNHEADFDPLVAVLLPDSVAVDPLPVEEAEAPATRQGNDRGGAWRGGDSVSRAEPKRNPWRKHGTNLVVARQAEVAEDAVFEFGRKRGHSGGKVTYRG